MGSTGSVIALTSRAPLSRGSFRSCYLHPDDVDKCIKVAHGQRGIRRREPDPNLREISEYNRLISAGAPVQRYFPRIYGLLETDLGPGLCVERLRGANGDAVPTVVSEAMRRLQSGLSVAPILKGIEELMEFCVEYGVLASCQELKNIGVVARAGSEAIMGYDVKVMPNKELVPLATYSAFFRRRKVARRFRRSLQEFERIIERAHGRGTTGRQRNPC